MRIHWAGMLAVLTWIASGLGKEAAAEYQSFFPYGDGAGGNRQANYMAVPRSLGYRTPPPMMGVGQAAYADPGLGMQAEGPMDGGYDQGGGEYDQGGGGYSDEGYAGGGEYGDDSGYAGDSGGGYGCGCGNHSADYGGYGDEGYGGYGGCAGGGMCGGDGRDGALFGGMGQGGPYENGGCGPRWFDLHAEALYWKRDNVSREVNFTSNGVAGNAPPNVVLSTRDLDFDNELGFRFTLRFEVGAVSAIEVGYFGIFDYVAEAQARSNNDNLFSVFSDFGNPPFFPGFSDTDEAYFHSIRYQSDLQNAEINLRRQWVSTWGRLHGSTLAGARYLRLTETLRHITRVDNVNTTGFMDYHVGTSNDLVGFQLGGDVWLCALPGLMVGGELEAGLYGVEATQDTTIDARTLPARLVEHDQSTDAALVSEGGAMVVYQLHPRFTIRGGYHVLYVDGVALAAENFNKTAPFVGPAPPRRATVNDNGAALYHGATLGLEYIW